MGKDVCIYFPSFPSRFSILIQSVTHRHQYNARIASNPVSHLLFFGILRSQIIDCLFSFSTSWAHSHVSVEGCSVWTSLQCLGCSVWVVVSPAFTFPRSFRSYILLMQNNAYKRTFGFVSKLQLHTPLRTGVASGLC